MKPFIDEVLQFITEKSNCKPENLCLDSSLKDDLGLSQEDITQLLEGYSKRFSVDLSEPEAEESSNGAPAGSTPSFFSHFSAWFCRRLKYIQKPKTKNLTVRDLVEGAFRKKLETVQQD